jgi:hypothetical protein
MQHMVRIAKLLYLLPCIVIVALQPIAAHSQSLEPGTYQSANSGDSISVTLVKVGQQVFIQSVGHNFLGSGIKVGAISAKDGKPFGTYDGNVLKFPIVFLAKFSPSPSLTNPGGNIELTPYSGMLSIKDQKVHLLLVMNGSDNDFNPSISNIGFSPAADGFTMKKSYDFDLSKK